MWQGLSKNEDNDKLVNKLVILYHMKSIGIFETKTHLSSILEEVEQGTSFTITRRGLPIAKIVPASSKAAAFDPQEAKAAAQAIKDGARGRKLSGISLRELIEEGRR